MTDYYRLLAQTITGLDTNATGEDRRALYERARNAQVAHLRSLEPAITESEVTGERLKLENAIRKVEKEAVARARLLADAFLNHRDKLALLADVVEQEQGRARRQQMDERVGSAEEKSQPHQFRSDLFDV